MRFRVEEHDGHHGCHEGRRNGVGSHRDGLGGGPMSE